MKVDNPYSGLVPETKQEEIMGKSIFRSKTIWVNALTAIAGIAATLGGSELIADNPKVAGIAAMITGVVNVLLRVVTKEPVTVKTKP